jgi:hypothetical protein
MKHQMRILGRHGFVFVGAVLCLGTMALAGGADRLGKGPLKVFILAGQSNMEGHGLSEHIKMAATDPSSSKDFKHLLDSNGNLIVRKDVWITYRGRKGNLTVGYGAGGNKVGPEIGFGWEMGERLKNQVLLIKTAWGGHSLKEKFLPPSAGGPGPSYTAMVTEVHSVLNNLKSNFPQYDGKGYEIVGLAWHQAWNDMIDRDQRGESPPYKTYTARQGMLLRDLRKEFKAPGMLMTIGECGVAGSQVSFRTAQEATALMPEFKKTMRFVKTAQFWDTDEKYKSNGGYHYNGSGRCYYLKGVAFAQGMYDLMPKITLADLPKHVDEHSKPVYVALKAKNYPAAYAALKSFESSFAANREGQKIGEEALEMQETVLDILTREIAGPIDLAIDDVGTLKSAGDFYRLSLVFPNYNKAFKGIDKFDDVAGTLEKDLRNSKTRTAITSGKRFYSYIEKVMRVEARLKTPRPAKNIKAITGYLQRFAKRDKDGLYGKAALIAADKISDPKHVVMAPAAYVQMVQ